MAKAGHSNGPKNLIKARFLHRPNRFTVICEVRGKQEKAYLPNPGRLWELLLPGSPLYIEKTSKGFTVWATEKNGHIVMLHTHFTNRIAEELIKDGAIPLLRNLQVQKREVTFGHSRLDLLLRDEKTTFPLEVKSCTLFSNGIAMFPDAVSLRARQHIEILSKHKGKVLFVVHSPDAKAFLPEFHIDPDFARTLYSLKDKIGIIPIAIRWDEKLRYHFVRQLQVPWYIYEEEARDRGVYILIMELKEGSVLEVGGLGRLTFKKGFYLYVGSARKALSKRVSRYLRRPKNKHWHIDYLSSIAKRIIPVPIRTSELLECEISKDLQRCFQVVKGFGSSDCNCQGHLFYSPEDPLRRAELVDTIIRYRIERLESKLMQERV